MSIFGDFYEKPLGFRRNKKEEIISHSEDWSAAILSGSSELVAKEEPVKNRIYYAVGVLVFISALFLVWRLFNIQIVNGQANSLLASSNKVRTVVIPAPRGTVYDRNGTVLARNTAQIDLLAVPSQLPKENASLVAMSEVIAGVTGQDKQELSDKLSNIAKSDKPNELLLSKVDRDKSLLLEEKIRMLPGLSLEVSPQREYLDNGLLAHFLGYIGRISQEEWQSSPEYRPVDMIGKSGIEKYYEAELKGVPGKEQIEVDATGKPIRLLARVEPVPGNDIILAIDWGLQRQLYNSLKAEIERSGSKAGSAVVLEPQTGEVLAAVNYPTFDANLFAKGIGQADYDKLINDDAKPLLNRVTSGNYPVGSIIKPFISVAGLQENIINVNTTIVDQGKLDVPNIYDPSIVYTFKGWKPEGLGPVNVVRAIQWSSDIYYYQVGGGYQSFQGLGEKRLIEWYQKFGLGKKTGLDISEESNGFLPSPDKKKKSTGESWYVGDTYNIAIGQGDLRSTPLQMAVANAAIANGGRILKPHLLKSINQSKRPVKTANPEVVLEKFISDKNLATVRQGMEEAVAGGTACCSIKTQLPVQVAGKTGTAETSSEGFDGKNPRTKPHSWFISYTPASDPKVAMVVMIENSGEGAEFALPASRESLKWYFQNR